MQYVSLLGEASGVLTILAVQVLNEHLSLLVERFVPTKVIRVRNNDKPWFNDYRRAFDLRQKGHLHLFSQGKPSMDSLQLCSV